MKRSNREEYTAERERAIVTLYNTVRRFRKALDTGQNTRVSWTKKPPQYCRLTFRRSLHYCSS